MSNYDDEAELKRLHTEEMEGGFPINGKQEQAGDLSDNAMQYLQQIKELKEQLEDAILGVQRLEMAILGYTKALEEELKGH
tara:strand:+ start:372 stop:614 length:243 start_codon:yes stop_codon:yes gene_type:complete